jgi:hypothetical protein
MNFIRIWGGGGVEKDAFYDACDRHGVMIYQETVHSQSMPTRDVNYDNGAIEVASMVRCAFSDRSLHRGCHWFPRLLLASSKQACDQCHSSRVSTSLTCSHCILRPNTEGQQARVTPLAGTVWMG